MPIHRGRDSKGSFYQWATEKVLLHFWKQKIQRTSQGKGEKTSYCYLCVYVWTI